MNASPQKRPNYLALLVTIGGLALCAVFLRFFGPGPRIRDTPMMREASRIREICCKLYFYASDDHSAVPGDTIGKSLDSFIASNVISPEDAAYIHDHHMEFHGFDPSKIGADIPVLETIFTNTDRPSRIVGYSDGSVKFYDLQKGK